MVAGFTGSLNLYFRVQYTSAHRRIGSARDRAVNRAYRGNG